MTDARTLVLEAIARAQSRGADETVAARRDSSAEPDYLMSSAPGVDVVALLVERLLDYRAAVVDVRAEPDQAVAIRAAVERELRARGARRVVVDVDFEPDWRPAGIDVVEDHGLAVAELGALDGAVTTCAAAVAVTGTIMLDHSAGQGRRVVSLVPDIHVCLVSERVVHGELPGAVRAVGARPLMTWISGPSATSDIELVRVEGVHGPRHLVVVIHR